MPAAPEPPAPAVPVAAETPEKPKKKTTVATTTTTTKSPSVAETQSAGVNEEIAAKRREIEEKLKLQAQTVNPTTAQEYGNTSLDDSALARIISGRKSTDVADEEMVDVGELAEVVRGFEDDEVNEGSVVPWYESGDENSPVDGI